MEKIRPVKIFRYKTLIIDFKLTLAQWFTHGSEFVKATLRENVSNRAIMSKKGRPSVTGHGKFSYSEEDGLYPVLS